MLVPLLLIAACSDDEDSADTTTAPVDSESEDSASEVPDTTASATDPATTPPETTAPAPTDPPSSTPSTSAPSGDGGVVAGEPFPEDRCAANQEAGTISYLTGFDFAAAASIMEVVLADELGYYDELCLDVEITPSFSTANYPLVASNDAQFSSAGSFTELVNFADINEADLVALSVDGHTAIDVLMVHPEVAGSLAEIEGTTIGVKGAIPPAIAAMLQREAGLIENEDYSTVLVEGFDVTAHWALPDLSGIPGWRSNEPGALTRAGLEFDLYDPSDYGIPGSFGLIYTNATFLEEHPTAAEDFMRATMRALADAIADPAAAAAVAVERINGNGNPNFLSPEGEAFRWETDAAAIVSSTPDGSDFGVPIGADLQAELDAYAEIGYFGDADTPTAEGRYHPDLVAELYQDGTVVWPAGA
jgi:NitT/TauT family transport system substrate-binding protein